MASDSGERVALVTGATGIIGSHVIKQVAGSGKFQKVFGVSRREPYIAELDKVQHLPLNLQDAKAVEQALRDSNIRDVSHIFHCAYVDTGDDVKDVEANLALLRNPVEAAEAVGCPLQHVYVQTGCKWYGQKYGFQKTPAKEDDPRHMPPNFYYDLVDYVTRRVAEGASWSWSELRPNPVCGYSRGSFMNLTTSLAVYAAISKELGLALRFPGTNTAWTVLLEVIDVELLAEAVEWTSTEPAGRNQSFNVGNGDLIRWNQAWPKIAEHFGLEVGPPLALPLAQAMRDKGPVWDRIVEKHGLEKTAYEDLATWDFLDFCMKQPCDWFSDLSKLRRAGFHKMQVDSTAMFLRQFQELAGQKIIPRC